MSLGSSLRQGSNAIVARSLGHGATEGGTLALLHSHFPRETPDTLDELYRRGVLAWQAAEQANLWDPAYPITRAQLPSSGGLPHGYSFYAVATVTDPLSGQSATTSIKVDFSSIPDRDTFAGALQDEALRIYHRAPRFPNDPYALENPQLTSYTIYAVELSR